MSEETEILVKEEARESKLGSLSVRGLITLIVVVTVCGMSLGKIDVKEPLYTMVGLVVGFYFAQREKPKP